MRGLFLEGSCEKAFYNLFTFESIPSPFLQKDFKCTLKPIYLLHHKLKSVRIEVFRRTKVCLNN
jgi:hypothetical protein